MVEQRKTNLTFTSLQSYHMFAYAPIYTLLFCPYTRPISLPENVCYGERAYSVKIFSRDAVFFSGQQQKYLLLNAETLKFIYIYLTVFSSMSEKKHRHQWTFNREK